ncbi:hypothetical protein CASFOL_015091 [Castilleja foliolosa]|uniref:Protein NUCLEAR FUSION DEFECTIVE 6, chloroplastic/mitochondrial-like n=1 Tax=Castilleja foliolosa TaxID=1961234 RepID=A0ABD3DCP9_9LAMI
MASHCARNIVSRSTSSAKSLLSRAQSHRSFPSVTSPLGGTARITPRRRPFFSSSRLPVELGCSESLMPLHSVTASALLKSMLSSKVGQWSVLSEAGLQPHYNTAFLNPQTKRR